MECVEERTTDWEGLTDLFSGLFEEHTTDWEGLSGLFSVLFDEPMPEPQAAAAAPGHQRRRHRHQQFQFVRLGHPFWLCAAFSHCAAFLGRQSDGHARSRRHPERLAFHG